MATSRGFLKVASAALAFAASAVLAQGAGGSGAGSGGGDAGGVGPKSLQDRMGTPGSPSANKLANADRNFLTRAAGSGLFEVEAARMAADKSQDEAVKRYAAMLVEHHQSANRELMGLAQSKSVALPTSMPAGKRRELNRLSRASGEEFDAAFVQGVGVQEHRRDVRLFREASRNSKDPDIKAWAGKTLPTLEQHMSQARELPAARRSLSPATQGS